MKTKLLIRIAFAALLVAALGQSNLLAKGNLPDIIAVKFHADWCGSCKKMGDVFTDLTNKFDGQSVLFVTLDKTNLSSKHQAELLVNALGLEKAYQENQGTGFILLLDGKNKTVLDKLTATQSIKEMGAKIKQHKR